MQKGSFDPGATAPYFDADGPPPPKPPQPHGPPRAEVPAARAKVVRYRRGRDDRDAKLRDLAGAALRGGTLAGELPWLVTGEAETGHRFGYALAVQDRGYTMLAAILEAVGSAGARANGLLVGGYLAHMCKSDPDRWASVLDSIYDDPRARSVLPELVMISGVTDASISRIARGVSPGAFPCDALDLLKYPHSVSGGTIAGCIEMLLGRPETGAAMVALRLVYHHFAKGGATTCRAILPRPCCCTRMWSGPGGGADHAPMDPWMWRGAALGRSWSGFRTTGCPSPPRLSRALAISIYSGATDPLPWTCLRARQGPIPSGSGASCRAGSARHSTGRAAG